MKLKMLLLFAASVSSVIVLACSEVVFPTPLPTATPAPTATPIVFPTPLPTATPFSIPSPLPTATPSPIIFPTPLPTATPAPTATPVSIPSPLPTATPSALVFPTPLPTATPAPTAAAVVIPKPLPTATPAPTATPISLSRRTTFYGQDDAFMDLTAAAVLAIRRTASGVGFAFDTRSELCALRGCILTVRHLVGDYPLSPIYDGSSDGIDKVALGVHKSDAELDLAVFLPIDASVASGLTPWRIAPRGTLVEVGDPIRVVTIDFYDDLRTGDLVADQMVIDGIVSRITRPGVEFMLTAPLMRGNSGGVILNTDMEVIGIVKDQLELRSPTTGRITAIPSRTRATHFEAIRAKLEEWDLLP